MTFLFRRAIHFVRKTMPPPDRWEAYSPMGSVIPGTKFLAFKVPLKEELLKQVEEKDRFSPAILMKLLDDKGLKLGAVIDLTFTYKYYNSEEEFVKNSVEHKKVFTPGHNVPSESVFQQFAHAVKKFDTGDNDHIIGVHCTHGVNRTGYLICRYMIEEMSFEPEVAISLFDEARGHKLERENYLEDLKTRKCGQSTYDPNFKVPDDEFRPGGYQGPRKDKSRWRHRREGHPESQREGHPESRRKYHDSAEMRENKTRSTTSQESSSAPDVKRSGTPRPLARTSRRCAGQHPYSQCQHAKDDTDFRKPNKKCKCANCLGNHGARYLGCPSHQDSKEAMKIATKRNRPYKEARRQHKATTRLTKTDKTHLEGQLKVLTSKLEDLEQKREQAQNTQVSAVMKVLGDIRCVQLKIEQDLASMAATKAETDETLRKIQEERKEFEIERAKTQMQMKQDMASMTAMKAELEENLKKIQEERKEFEMEKAKTQKLNQDMARKTIAEDKLQQETTEDEEPVESWHDCLNWMASKTEEKKEKEQEDKEETTTAEKKDSESEGEKEE